MFVARQNIIEYKIVRSCQRLNRSHDKRRRVWRDNELHESALFGSYRKPRLLVHEGMDV